MTLFFLSEHATDFITYYSEQEEKRFSNYAPSSLFLLPTQKYYKQQNATKSSDDNTDNERHIAAINRLKIKWRLKRKRDTFWPVNADSLVHNNAVRALLNHQPNIKKNINKEKQTNLLKALNEGNWNATIFNDQHFIELALALYIDNKIVRMQFETLMNWHHAQLPVADTQPLKTRKAFQIITQTGEFSLEAQFILLRRLEYFMKHHFTATEIEQFRILMNTVKARFPSENIFFISEINDFDFAHDKFAKRLTKDRVGSTLHTDNTLKAQIHLSYIAREIMKIISVGSSNAFPAATILGHLTIDDIYKAIENGFRPKAGRYPNIPFNPDIHTHKLGQFSPQSAADHDEYHADIMSREGFILRGAFLHSIHIIESMQALIPGNEHADLKRIFCKTKWNFVDSELTYFNSINEQKKVTGEFFSTVLITDEESVKRTVLYFNKQQITDIGIACFTNMALFPKLWQDELKINPEDMISHYKTHYELAKNLVPYFKQDNLKYNIFLYRTALALDKVTMKQVIHFVDAFYNNNEKDFVMYRNNKISFLGLIDLKNESVAKHETIASLTNFFNEHVILLSIYSSISDCAHTNDYIANLVLKPLYNYIVELKKEHLKPELLNQTTTNLGDFLNYHQKTAKHSNLSECVLSLLQEASQILKEEEECSLINNTPSFNYCGI